MGKMTSLLEKYKLIEKEDIEQNAVSDTSDMTDTEMQSIPAEEPTPEIEEEPAAYESAPVLSEPVTHEAANEPAPIEETESPYNEIIKIDNVYGGFGLKDLAVTDTVFLLENLINALPGELPEFVKKTTVNNIIEASAMNLSALLNDGQLRSQYLSRFISDYTSTNEKEIADLKEEINKLSAVIAEYHQLIKYKETLIADETQLIQTEQQRLKNILEFFG